MWRELKYYLWHHFMSHRGNRSSVTFLREYGALRKQDRGWHSKVWTKSESVQHSCQSTYSYFSKKCTPTLLFYKCSLFFSPILHFPHFGRFRISLILVLEYFVLTHPLSFFFAMSVLKALSSKSVQNWPFPYNEVANLHYHFLLNNINLPI